MALRAVPRFGRAAAGLALAAALAASAAADGVKFRHIAFDSPLDVSPRAGETLGPAVRKFHATGRNPYAGDAEAVAQGKKLYEAWCQSCHLPDGSGGMGASLIGERPLYARVATDVGLFEAVYGGALGAMQAFNERLTQDEILRLTAYVRALRER